MRRFGFRKRLIEHRHPIARRLLRESHPGQHSPFKRIDISVDDFSYTCVNVNCSDSRYNPAFKEGDVLGADELVEILTDAEFINGTAEMEPAVNQDTAENCIKITLSSSDNEDEEEKSVCEYLFVVKVEEDDIMYDLIDEIEKAAGN